MTNGLIDEIKKLEPEEKIEIKLEPGKSSELVCITRVHHASRLSSCFRSTCKVYLDELLSGNVEQNVLRILAHTAKQIQQKVAVASEAKS